MKRKSLVMVLAAAMTLGCCSVNVMADDGVTIQFWNSFTGTDGDVLREIVDRFNEENEDGDRAGHGVCLPTGVFRVWSGRAVLLF